MGIRAVISRVTMVVTFFRVLRTLLISTREPSSTHPI